MVFSRETFTTPVVVTGIFPVNKWEKKDGKNVDTGIREATRVEVLIKTSAFEQDEKLGVKIESLNLPLTEEQIKESRAKNSPVYILFENLNIKPYNPWDAETKTLKPMTYSATATGLTVVSDNDTVQDAQAPAPAPPQPAPKAKPKV